MQKILNVITTFLGSGVSTIAIVAKVLNIVLDLAGRIVAVFNWRPAEEFVDWIEKHNIEGWLERIAKLLKKYKER